MEQECAKISNALSNQQIKLIEGNHAKRHISRKKASKDIKMTKMDDYCR